MKSNLIASRKKANILVSPQVLQQALQEAKELEPILRSTNDPRLPKLLNMYKWLSGSTQPDDQLENSLDDATSPQVANFTRENVEWISQLKQELDPHVEQTEIPPVWGQQASAGGDPWVTDRDAEAKPEPLERVEVPRLSSAKKDAARKIAQPGAAGAAPAATPMPMPPAASPSPAAKGGGSIDTNQMSSEALAAGIEAWAKTKDLVNDKATVKAIEVLTNALGGRPAEPAPVAAPAAAAAPKAAAADFSGGEPSGDPEVVGGPNLSFGGLNTAAAEEEKTASGSKVAVTPPGISEKTMHELKDEYPGEKDKAYATAWSIHNKKEGTLREKLAQMHRELDAYVLRIAAGDQGGSWFVEDQDTMDVKEDGGRTPEIAEAHGLEDLGPAKLDKHETTLPITLNGSKQAADAMTAAKALKKVEKLADQLKNAYLDAKEITEANDSRPVREAVEAIYRAYDMLGLAAKVLGKQQMQEDAEEEAIKVKEKGKKKGSLLDSLALAAAE